MKRFFLIVLCLSFAMFSCKKTLGGKNAEKQGIQSQEITEKDISKIDYIEFLLDEKAEEFVVQWEEYNQLRDVIDDIKAGDLSFFYDNKETIEVTLTEFKTNIPKALNSASIIARITAFETKFLNLESLYNLDSKSKEELLNSIKDVLVAFSNLNLQMNKKVEFDAQEIQKP
jgi:hypothetical protein